MTSLKHYQLSTVNLTIEKGVRLDGSQTFKEIYKRLKTMDNKKGVKYSQSSIRSILYHYEKYVKDLDKVEIKEGLKIAMEISSLGNKYLQDSKFWETENKKSGRSQIVSGVTCNYIRLVSFVIEPYMPSTSAKINFLLGI